MEAEMRESLARWRVVVLGGARQVGKSTLARRIGGTYRTLDDDTLLSAARLDPKAFLFCDDFPMVIDEIQRAPELLSAIKMAVDSDPRPGQFLLTGSADIFSLPTAQESLAGRVRHLELSPLTQGEIDGRRSSFLRRLREEDFAGSWGSGGQRNVLERAFRGGFPEALAWPHGRRARWYEEYARARIERDLTDFAKIYRQRGMSDLLLALAAWSGNLLNGASLSSSLGISWNTLQSYLEYLKLLYIIREIRPWRGTDCAVGAARKLYLRDTGLIAALLGWNLDEVALNPERLGKFVETLVFNELYAQIGVEGDRWRLLFYRNQKKQEIDFLLVDGGGKLYGIEVKAGTAIGRNDGKNLRHFAEICKRDFTGILLYGGEISWRLDRHTLVVPLNALWA
jgi:predicted AAA+ superfamily ATPase